MLTATKRLYRLSEFKVEHRDDGWYFTRAAFHGDREGWRGPYSSIPSLTLVIARELRREIMRRDAAHVEAPS